RAARSRGGSRRAPGSAPCSGSSTSGSTARASSSRRRTCRSSASRRRPGSGRRSRCATTSAPGWVPAPRATASSSAASGERPGRGAATVRESTTVSDTRRTTARGTPAGAPRTDPPGEHDPDGPDPRTYPARAVVDLEAVRDNVRALAGAAPSAAVMAVVKADAYGHGLVPSALGALAGGATWLGTAQPGEALALRAAGIGPDRARILTWLYAPGAALRDLVG